jgi:NTP pyrophosphatase (non-canonical NTP hydrolase)
MKVKEFEQFIRESARMGLEDDAYNVIGLCGEAGEVAEWFKKMVFRTKSGAYGKDAKLTELDLLNELGDVLHYTTRILLSKGWTVKDAMTANHVKLLARQAKDTQ